MFRRKMSRSASKRNFYKGARNVNRKNYASQSGAGPMRGGIRL